MVCFFFLPYFVGFQLFGLIVAQEGQIKPDNPKTTHPNQPAKQKSGIRVVGCLVIYCPEIMAPVRNQINPDRLQNLLFHG